MDWLTWQAIRGLATIDALKDQHEVRFAAANPAVKPGSRPTVTVPAGGVIYARDSWRAPWRTSLSKVPVPCVLVTAFNDAHVQDHALEMFDGQIQHWFAVQVNTAHPRLTAMPIGIDGRDVTTLCATAARSWEDRDILCLSNFQQRTPERKSLHAWCRQQPWMTTDPWKGPITPRSLLEYYALLGRSKFVLSPPGRGWDCYRTYEALAMGAIPIVRRQRPISDVVEGLPVLVVDRWSDVTPELLASGRPDGTLEKMMQAYWDERILSYGTHRQSAQ